VIDMSWKYERQRHSMAKRGIRTSENYKERFARRKKTLNAVVEQNTDDPESLFYKSRIENEYVEIPGATKDGNWFFDRGAMPGEPYGYYGIENNDIDTAKAVIYIDDLNNFIIYTKNKKGKFIFAGEYENLNEAMNDKNWKVN